MYSNIYAIDLNLANIIIDALYVAYDQIGDVFVAVEQDIHNTTDTNRLFDQVSTVINDIIYDFVQTIFTNIINNGEVNLSPTIQ